MKTTLTLAMTALLLGACIRNEKVSPQDTKLEQEQVDDTLKRGQFITRDAGHPTSGTVYLIKKKDGTQILQFDKLSTGAGPDVDILLSKSETYSANGVIKIDDLKYSGSFFIALPKQIDVAEYHTVMIWCEAYDILFATCKLQ